MLHSTKVPILSKHIDIPRRIDPKHLRRGERPFEAYGRIAAMRRLALLCLITLCASPACSPKKAATPHPKVPHATFRLGEVRAVDSQDRADSNQKAQAEGAKIQALLNAMYDIAFVSPNLWAGGKHPKLTDFFDAEAQPTLAGNLGGLALTDVAPKLKSVSPTKAQITKLSVFIDADGGTPFAVASIDFEGRGSTKLETIGPITIVHTATYWFAKEGDTYKIMAYGAELKADTVIKTAAWGDPPSMEG